MYYYIAIDVLLVVIYFFPTGGGGGGVFKSWVRLIHHQIGHVLTHPVEWFSKARHAI